MKNSIILFFSVIVLGAQAQESPVSFNFYTTGDTLVIEGEIERGWHMYAVELPSDEGPVATEVTFTAADNYTLTDSLVVDQPHASYDATFEMELFYYDNSFTFKQVIESKSETSFTIQGNIMFMVCNDETCLPPIDVPMSFTIKKEDVEATK